MSSGSARSSTGAGRSERLGCSSMGVFEAVVIVSSVARSCTGVTWVVIARYNARPLPDHPAAAHPPPATACDRQAESHSGHSSPADTSTAGPVRTVVRGPTSTDSRPPGTSTTTVPSVRPSATSAA